MDELLERIEWGTLLFFAALFILMEVRSLFEKEKKQKDEEGGARL